MNRILILGGGVGGTLTANLLVKKLRRQVKAGEVTITVVDQTGQHTYQPGFMYIAMGGERAENLQRPERGLLDSRVTLVVGEVEKVDEKRRPSTSPTASALAYDYLVLATGSRIVPEAIEHFEAEAQHFYTAEAALELRQALDAFTGGRIVIGIAGHALQVPAGAAGGRLPDRGRASPARPARDDRAPLLLADRARLHDRERVRDGHARSSSGRASSCTPSSTSRPSIPSARSSRASRARSSPYDLLILVPPHKGQQFLIDSGLAPAPGGWLPTDRATLQVGGRPNVFALGDATDLPLSKAGSTAHFEAPVVTERIVAAIEGREVDRQRGDYLGKVMCFFEIGDGKGTLLQFDYEHPPRPPKPNQLWHLGKIVFNKTYWHTVPKGRV